jgi:hypothetical protein
VAPLVGSSSQAAAAKSKKYVDGILCLRCDTKGHVATECTVVLCIYCDSAKHQDKDCHLLTMPKPTAVLYGLCREDLNFYDVPHNKDMKQKNDSGKVGRVRITGGSMSIQKLIMEFEWLVPGDHQWDITPVGHDAFRLVFPTKADLGRMKRLKPVGVQGTTITMHFEDWTSRRLDKWGIYDIWIRVFGCPDTLCRDFLGLFAVGSLVGKTKEVDMKFTREHGIARMRIDCTIHSLTISMMVKGSELSFMWRLLMGQWFPPGLLIRRRMMPGIIQIKRKMLLEMMIRQGRRYRESK